MLNTIAVGLFLFFAQKRPQTVCDPDRLLRTQNHLQTRQFKVVFVHNNTPPGTEFLLSPGAFLRSENVHTFAGVIVATQFHFFAVHLARCA